MTYCHETLGLFFASNLLDLVIASPQYCGRTKARPSSKREIIQTAVDSGIREVVTHVAIVSLIVSLWRESYYIICIMFTLNCSHFLSNIRKWLHTLFCMSIQMYNTYTHRQLSMLYLCHLSHGQTRVSSFD